MAIGMKAAYKHEAQPKSPKNAKETTSRPMELAMLRPASPSSQGQQTKQRKDIWMGSSSGTVNNSRQCAAKWKIGLAKQDTQGQRHDGRKACGQKGEREAARHHDVNCPSEANSAR